MSLIDALLKHCLDVINSITKTDLALNSHITKLGNLHIMLTIHKRHLLRLDVDKTFFNGNTKSHT